MMMRRYRYVEEGMTMGRQEDATVVSQTRDHYKLWNRIDAQNKQVVDDKALERYKDIINRGNELLIPGLAEQLEQGGDGHCDKCLYRDSYGAETTHCFGGVQLCVSCKDYWGVYLLSLSERAVKVFPELKPVYDKAIVNVAIPVEKLRVAEKEPIKTVEPPRIPKPQGIVLTATA